MSRLGIRKRLLVAVLLAVVVGLGALLAGFNILLAHELDANANDLVRARADAELNLLRPQGDRVLVGEAPDEASPDAPVWVFSHGKLLEGPRAGRATAADAALAARRVSTRCPRSSAAAGWERWSPRSRSSPTSSRGRPL